MLQCGVPNSRCASVGCQIRVVPAWGVKLAWRALGALACAAPALRVAAVDCMAGEGACPETIAISSETTLERISRKGLA